MTAEEKLAAYQTAAVDFCNQLCDPSASDRIVAWTGAKAAMAFFTLTDQMDGLRAALNRLRNLNPPPGQPSNG